MRTSGPPFRFHTSFNTSASSAPILSFPTVPHPACPWSCGERVAATWEPSRLQRGPHTGRGAKPAGLVADRTRSPFKIPPAAGSAPLVFLGFLSSILLPADSSYSFICEGPGCSLRARVQRGPPFSPTRPADAKTSAFPAGARSGSREIARRPCFPSFLRQLDRPFQCSFQACSISSPFSQGPIPAYTSRGRAPVGPTAAVERGHSDSARSGSKGPMGASP